jgi:hypothetical protein
MQATAQEQGVVFLGKLFGPLDQLGLQRQHRLQGHRQVPHVLQVAGFVGLAQAAFGWASASVSRNRPASWVVKALVLATPISTPARVM